MRKKKELNHKKEQSDSAIQLDMDDTESFTENNMDSSLNKAFKPKDEEQTSDEEKSET